MRFGHTITRKSNIAQVNSIQEIRQAEGPQYQHTAKFNLPKQSASHRFISRHQV